MVLLTAVLARAGPVFLDADEGVVLDMAGNWPKVWPDPEGGYHMLYATVGVYNYQHGDEAFVPDHASRRVLTTDRDWLQDHAVTACPDGTFLHVASASRVDHDDSAYAYLYDDRFNLLKSAVLAEGRVGQWWNDMPVVCGETFRGLAYYDATHDESLVFVELDEDLAIVREVGLHGAPFALGSAFLEEDGLLKVIGAPNKDGDGIIYAAFDGDYELVDRIEVGFSPAGWSPYWTQGLARYGAHYLVGHLAQDTAQEWEAQGGDLWVEAFDRDWNHLDQRPLSANTPPVGGRQPFLSITGSTLHALYAKEGANYLYRVQLAERGDTPDDTGGSTDPAGDPRVPYTPAGCACASAGRGLGPSPALGLGLAAAVLARGRRR